MFWCTIPAQNFPPPAMRGKACCCHFCGFRALLSLMCWSSATATMTTSAVPNPCLTVLPVDKLLTSVPQQLSRHDPKQCESGQSWDWDGIKFDIISPQLGTFVSDNDNSCVLQIQAKQSSALLTGDIEAMAESWLVSTYGGKLKADVLIAPHHGSHTSSSAPFLNVVKPSVILIPAGYRNQFGHPHEEVLQRYRQFKFAWLDSANEGALHVSFDNGLNIESWRRTLKGVIGIIREAQGKRLKTKGDRRLPLFYSLICPTSVTTPSQFSGGIPGKEPM